MWYRWTAPASGLVQIEACSNLSSGRYLSTQLGVYTGSALAALTPVRWAYTSDWGGRCGNRRDQFVAIAGTTYRIAVDGHHPHEPRYNQGDFELELRASNPPPNDNFADAHDLGAGSTLSAAGSNVDATVEPGEPYHAGWAVASVWYRWTAPASRTFQIDACESGFWPVLAVYRGSALNALSGVASSKDTDCNGPVVRFHATDGTTYRIAIDGEYGFQGEFGLEIKPAIALRLGLGKVRRNPRRGTATLIARVPGPGSLRVYHRKSYAITPSIAVEAPGKVRLPIRAAGKAKQKLNNRGRVKARAIVIYRPADAELYSHRVERTKYVTLIKRR